MNNLFTRYANFMRKYVNLSLRWIQSTSQSCLIGSFTCSDRWKLSVQRMVVHVTAVQRDEAVDTRLVTLDYHQSAANSCKRSNQISLTFTASSLVLLDHGHRNIGTTDKREISSLLRTVTPANNNWREGRGWNHFRGIENVAVGAALVIDLQLSKNIYIAPRITLNKYRVYNTLHLLTLYKIIITTTCILWKMVRIYTDVNM